MEQRTAFLSLSQSLFVLLCGVPPGTRVHFLGLSAQSFLNRPQLMTGSGRLLF